MAPQFPAKGETRLKFELVTTPRFEVEIGRPAGRWQAENRGLQ